jgi:hypothetical protein
MSLIIGIVKGNRQFGIVEILAPEQAEFLYDFYIHQTNPPRAMVHFIKKPYILRMRWCQEASIFFVIARSPD